MLETSGGSLPFLCVVVQAMPPHMEGYVFGEGGERETQICVLLGEEGELDVCLCAHAFIYKQSLLMHVCVHARTFT